jgi:hypothetical protein
MMASKSSSIHSFPIFFLGTIKEYSSSPFLLRTIEVNPVRNSSGVSVAVKK